LEHEVTAILERDDSGHFNTNISVRAGISWRVRMTHEPAGGHSSATRIGEMPSLERMTDDAGLRNDAQVTRIQSFQHKSDALAMFSE
jgi:hypothetical protein